MAKHIHKNDDSRTAWLDAALAFHDYQIAVLQDSSDLFTCNVHSMPHFALVNWEMSEKRRLLSAFAKRDLFNSGAEDGHSFSATANSRGHDTTVTAYRFQRGTENAKCKIEIDKRHIHVLITGKGCLNAVVIDLISLDNYSGAKVVPLLNYHLPRHEADFTEPLIKRELEHLLAEPAREDILIVSGLELAVETYLKASHLDTFVSFARHLGYDSKRIIFLCPNDVTPSSLVVAKLELTRPDKYLFGTDVVTKLIETDLTEAVQKSFNAIVAMVGVQLRKIKKLKTAFCHTASPKDVIYYESLVKEYAATLCDLVVGVARQNKSDVIQSIQSAKSLRTGTESSGQIAEALLASLAYNFEEEQLQITGCEDLKGLLKKVIRRGEEQMAKQGRNRHVPQWYVPLNHYLSGQLAVGRVLSLTGYCMLESFQGLDYSAEEIMAFGATAKDFSCHKAIREMILQRRPQMAIIADVVQWSTWLYNRQAPLISERFRSHVNSDLHEFGKLLDYIDHLVASQYGKILQNNAEILSSEAERMIRFRFHVARFEELANQMHLLGYSCFKPIQQSHPASSNEAIHCQHHGGRLAISINLSDRPFEPFSVESPSASFHESLFFSLKSFGVNLNDIGRGQVEQHRDALNNIAEMFARYKWGAALMDIFALIESELNRVVSSRDLGNELHLSVKRVLKNETFADFASKMYQITAIHGKREAVLKSEKRLFALNSLINLIDCLNRLWQTGMKVERTDERGTHAAKIDPDFAAKTMATKLNVEIGSAKLEIQQQQHLEGWGSEFLDEAIGELPDDCRSDYFEVLLADGDGSSSSSNNALLQTPEK